MNIFNFFDSKNSNFFTSLHVRERIVQIKKFVESIVASLTSFNIESMDTTSIRNGISAISSTI